MCRLCSQCRLTDLKFARKMKVKQQQVDTPAQADLTDTGKISPTRTQGTGPRPSVKEKVKPDSQSSIIFRGLQDFSGKVKDFDLTDGEY